MQTQQFTYRDPQVEAAQIPADEEGQNAIAEHFGGSMKGTRLPPPQREFQVWSQGAEHTAIVGDWVTKSISEGIRTHRPEAFAKIFEQGEGFDVKINNIIEKFGLPKEPAERGPLAPMTIKAASDLATSVAAQHQPPYFSEPFAPHPWVVDAIILASTAPQFKPKSSTPPHHHANNRSS